MSCPQCVGVEKVFNARFADDELNAYRLNGADETTQILVEALIARGVQGTSLLDIGGGVGAIQHALLKAGVSHALSVDASTAYTRVAEQEADSRGVTDLVERQHGNFVDIAPDLDGFDVVTLDRVICCYHDMMGLVGASSGKARRLYGVVYPRSFWWLRALMAFQHVVFRVIRHPMRFFAHRTADVEGAITRSGLRRVFHRNKGMWQVAIFEA